MEPVMFKIKDNKLNIMVDKNISNSEFLKVMKKRLQHLLVLKNDLAKEVILDISSRQLDNREILQLFDILNDVNLFYLGKVICHNKSKNMISIFKGSVRGGQIRFFQNSALIIGSINKGSKVIVNGDLYVLGNVYGEIELKNADSKLYCQNIYNSLIKIGDRYELISEDLSNKEIYLKDDKILKRDYKKGVDTYVESDSYYIW